ncbi:MAG: hypothetical protein U9M94_00630 [Patescibacteria group bacterium]|nr:hypothetical protein [Patescibacteria group bacterium]
MSMETLNLEQKEIFKFKDTAEFLNLIKQNDLSKAEESLEYVKKNRAEYPDYDDRWVDLRELDLFRAYRKSENHDCANQTIENMDKDNEHSKKCDSKQGRINVLSKEIDEYNQNHE